jgi:integrase
MSNAKRIKSGIYYRGPHQYQVKIRRNGANVNQTFETLAAAEKFRAVQMGKIVAHEYVDTKKERRTTLRSVLQRYKAEVTPTKKGARQERNRLDHWIASDLAAYSIAAIEPKDIADWIAAQAALCKAPSTISNAVNLLSAVFRRAREWGFNVENPCQGVSRPAARPARFAVMSEDEQRLLIQACERGPEWLPLIVRLALTTGMRQGELRRLNWRHVHKEWLHLPETKNGGSRDVPLTAAAESVINDLREKLPRRFDGWVFGDPDLLSAEGGFTEWQVQQAYGDAARWAEEHLGVRKRTFHDLRHVALTALAELHDNVIELQRTSGHKTLAVLARYLNETPDKTARKVRERETRRGGGVGA